mmetsp:Transcript_1432/g.2339  ORF Transcript_1432/g.2339 Transcript_1432/m.2339 type:complete len:590 (+) Transcript_1432:21-1790(+)
MTKRNPVFGMKGIRLGLRPALVALVVFIVAGIPQIVKAPFPTPTHGTKAFCFDLDCVKDTVEAVEEVYKDPVIIGMLSHSFVEDSYLAVYMGSILELFDMPDMTFVVLVLQNPPQASLLDTAYVYIQILPERSIFVSIEHGASSIGMRSLKTLRSFGVAPRVVLHLNHEQPWETNDPASLNYIFESSNRLSKLYADFDLVMRNYYYTPLLGTSYYLPVGAPNRGFVIRNDTSEIYTRSKQRTASQRASFCHFRGRVDYARYSVSSTLQPVVEVSDELMPHAQERRELLRLAGTDKLGGCNASATEMNSFEARLGNVAKTFISEYLEYMSLLSNTVFVLCPAGNNPETFRHYEALEMGAIPVFLRPALADRNFLQHELWNNYPGPILSDWSEFDAYANKMRMATTRELDELQQQVKEWYSEFKLKEKSSLHHLLKRTFAPREAAPSPTTGTGSTYGYSSSTTTSGSSSSNAGTVESIAVSQEDSSSGRSETTKKLQASRKRERQEKDKEDGASSSPSSSSSSSSSSSNPATDDTTSSSTRVIQDLRFTDISPGTYQANLQSLLAMVLKQDSRIRNLENVILQQQRHHPPP